MHKSKLLIIVLLLSHSLTAQHWKWDMGLNNTVYDFKSSTGIANDYMKPVGGVHIGFAYNKELIDTTELISKFSKTAIFFGNHQKLAKITSYFRYEIGLGINQFNSVGDIQNIALNYQTNFVGLTLGFGPEVKIYKGFSLALRGQVGVHKMLAGTQQINNRYYSLADNEMFSPLQVFPGYSVELHKSLSDKISAYVHYSTSSTMRSWSAGKATLNFVPTTLSIGLKISKF